MHKPKKTAIISGGTRGLGRCLSLVFGRAGFHVVSLYSRDLAAAQALEKTFADDAIEGVVCKRDEIRCDETSELVLINNAVAPFEPKPFRLWNRKELQEQLETSLFLSHGLCEEFLPQMVSQKRGTIVNILSSVVTQPAAKGYLGYSIGKHALLGLSKTLSAEYSRLGVKVFSVCPSFMETSLTKAWNELIRRSLAQAAPPQAVEEVARFILEKVQDETTQGTGEDYAVHSN